jgi:cytochrome c oxidase subunit 4
MSDHKEPNYVAIFVVLALLTVAEIGVVFMPVGKTLIGSMLVIMALTKAFLVGAYFMHLKFENRTLALIAITPLVLCVGLLFALMPDSNPALVANPPEAGSTAKPAEH